MNCDFECVLLCPKSLFPGLEPKERVDQQDS